MSKNKNTLEGGDVNVSVAQSSALNMPIKLLAYGAGIGAAAFGGNAGYDAVKTQVPQRIETIQVADAETKNALKEILETIQSTREAVIVNTGKIEAIGATQKDIKIRVDKNETDIERVERKTNQ